MTNRVQAHVEQLLSGPDLAPLVAAGHPVLRGVAAPYVGQLAAATLTELIALMRRTMHAAPGVGLAAPQIGVPLAIAVLEDPGAIDPDLAATRERPPLAFRVLVNPVYEPVGTELVSFPEGCLSLAGRQAVVVRHRRVRLTGQDQCGGELDEIVSGWPARIVAHESDHLRGVLYLDRIEPGRLRCRPGPNQGGSQGCP